jgi:hypothetical protein
VKALFTLALAVTQLLASSASPLYFCLSADGSKCIDFGPATCACCEQDHEHAGVRGADHDDCCDHQQSARATAQVDDPCDCRHVRISEPQSVTRSADINAPHGDRHVLSLIAIPFRAIAPLDGTSADLGRQSCGWLHAPPPALALLATVVIRC